MDFSNTRNWERISATELRFPAGDARNPRTGSAYFLPRLTGIKLNSP